jgi:guanylate kinase
MVANGEFLEYAGYCGNFYGTPKAAVEQMLAQGYNVFLEIEVNGGMQIKAKFPSCISIFIMPPSMEDLEKRLRGRGTEKEEQISGRLKTALTEITYADKYDFVIVNHKVEQAVEEIIAIVNSQE